MAVNAACKKARVDEVVSVVCEPVNSQSKRGVEVPAMYGITEVSTEKYVDTNNLRKRPALADKSAMILVSHLATPFKSLNELFAK